MRIHILLSICLALLAMPAAAERPLLPPELLMVDKQAMAPDELAFPNDDKISPSVSDFELVSFVLMSGDNGERWAALTLKNTSSGTRFLQSTHLLALFANGERKAPLKVKQRFRGNETLSLNVPFGIHKFPILSVYTANDG